MQLTKFTALVCCLRTTMHMASGVFFMLQYQIESFYDTNCTERYKCISFPPLRFFNTFNKMFQNVCFLFFIFGSWFESVALVVTLTNRMWNSVWTSPQITTADKTLIQCDTTYSEALFFKDFFLKILWKLSDKSF